MSTRQKTLAWSVLILCMLIALVYINACYMERQDMQDLYDWQQEIYHHKRINHGADLNEALSIIVNQKK